MPKSWNRFISSVAGSVVAVASASASASTAHPGLIAYYSFDDQSNLGADTSGNNYSLTPIGTNSDLNLSTSGGIGPGFVAGTTQNGVIGGGAASFNGIDDALIGDEKSLYPSTASNSISISFRVETPDATNATKVNNGKNISRGNASGKGINILTSGAGTPTYRATPSTGTSLNSSQSEQSTWDSVVITLDGTTGAFTIYVDNKPGVTESGATYAPAVSGFFGIGAQASTANSAALNTFLLGNIDEFAIYDFVLSSSQISSLASGSTALQVVPEPSSLMMVGFTSVCLLRRRRRARI